MTKTTSPTYPVIVRTLRSVYDVCATTYENIFDRSSGSYSDVGKEELWSMVTLAAPRDGECIVDVACGTGRLTLQLASDSRSVCGVDISLEMLHVLRQKRINDSLFLVAADALYLPFADGIFNLLTCMGMFDYYSPTVIAAILIEFRRVLRLDGRIAFSVQNRDAPGIELYIADSEAELGVPIHTYRMSDLVAICSHAGLRIENQARAGLQWHVAATPT